MKNKKYYLSKLALWAFLAAGGLLVVALCALWVLCLQAGRQLWLCGGLSLLFVLFCLLFYRRVYRPYQVLERIMALFGSGYTVEGVFSSPYQISPATEQAVAQVQKMLHTRELLSASKRQAQYLALQNQINPHFLYNTLEGIRGEALSQGSDNIAWITEALATFFRYSISNLENLVTLEDELSNVENYFLIQQYRFGKQLALEVSFDSDEDRLLLLHAKLPKLSLQPIVENAIIHGLEGKVGYGTVTLHIQGTARRLLIQISDDGLGMNPDTLTHLNEKLNNVFYGLTEKEDQCGGGIALLNVNNRIRLLFGEEYGISVVSDEGAGTSVDLTLPLDGPEDKLT